MKYVFDQHVPRVIPEFFQAMKREGHFTGHGFEAADNYVAEFDPNNDDRPWMARFKEDGGEVVFTGDRKIRSKLHEQRAYLEHGLILYMPHPRWNELRLPRKLAFILAWWERIAEHSSTADRPSCWEIPLSWTGGDFADKTGPHRLISKPSSNVRAITHRR